MAAENKNIAIIGAGLAGLTLANKLANHATITVFEKARGVGGRMATRYTDDYEFDHGAQFFIAKSTEFNQFLGEIKDKNIVAPWNARFVEIDNKEVTLSRTWDVSPIHYVAAPRMNALCKYLSRDINIKLNTRIVSLKNINNRWSLSDDNSNIYEEYDWVISAAPCEQTIALFPKTSFSHEIQQIKMLPCFSLMLGYQQLIDLPWDAAVIKSEIISWVANNSSKPGREKLNCLIVHSTNDWAEINLERDLEALQDELIRSASSILPENLVAPDYINIHRWKYANAYNYSDRKFYIDENAHLAACGDWCIKGRVEAAYLSASSLYKEICHVI